MTLVLVVEDKPEKRADRVALLQALECNVVAAESTDQAVRFLKSSPNFDLVVCDINFMAPGDTSSEAESDSSGIAFGEWVKREKYPTTLAGYSGHFGEDTPTARRAQNVYKNFATKGKVDSDDLLNLFEDWIALAGKTKQSRLEQARMRIVDVEDLKLHGRAAPDFERIKRLQLDVEHNPQDEALVSEGYSLQIVQPVLPDSKPAGRPFLAWIRKGGDAVDVEVFQLPILYCSAGTVDDALDRLSDLMVSYYEELQHDQTAMGPAQALKSFLDEIFSSVGALGS